MIRGLIKIFGGSNYKYKWIIQNFPFEYERLNYLEPFVGSGVVFLNKKISPQETINDLDPRICSMWYATVNRFEEFYSLLSKIEYKEETFNKAKLFTEQCNDPFNFDLAINSYIVFRMSRCGLCKDFAIGERQRGGKPGDINAFENSLKNLINIKNRTSGVVLLNCDFVKESYWESYLDNPNYLIHIDPPFLPSTRVAKKAYRFEMTVEDHKKMLKKLINAKAKISLLSYESPLYDEYLNGWRKEFKITANHSGQNKKKAKRVDCLYLNY